MQNDYNRTAQRPVLVLASTGFIIRNLLLGTFAEIVAASSPLIVAVPNAEDIKLRAIVKDIQVQLAPFLFDPPCRARSRLEQMKRWQTYIYRFKQGERPTASIDIQTRLFESRHSASGKAGIQSLIMLGRTLKQAGLIGLVEDQYLRSVARWPITRRWKQVLERWKPATVVSTMLTHSTLHESSNDLPAVIAANALGIPCGTLVQSWDNLTSKTAVMPPWLDRYWTWSETMTEDLLSLNSRVAPERVRVVGSPQFDFHNSPGLAQPRELYLGNLGLDPRRPYVLIGTGTKTWLPNEPLTVVRLVEELRLKLPKCQALIRLHPKDDGRRWSEYRERLVLSGAVIQETAPPVHMDLGGFVPPKEFYYDQINCITHAAAVINTASTLTIDAAILDRPTICIAYDEMIDLRFPEGRARAFSESSHYASLVATQGVTLVHSRNEAIQAIEVYLANPDLHSVGRRKIVIKVTGNVDGGAGERLASEVLMLAHMSGISSSEKPKKEMSRIIRGNVAE